MPKTAIFHFLPFSNSETLKPLDEFCGVKILHRAIITGKRAGIEKFYLWKEPNLDLEKSLKEDKRIGECWQWWEPSQEIIDTPILLYGIYTILHPKHLKNYLEENTHQKEWLTSSNKSLYMAILPHANYLENILQSNISNSNILENLATQLPNQEFSGFAYTINSSIGNTIPNGEKAFLSTFSSTLDGIVDIYFNRPLGRLITLPLVRRHVSANVVSIVGILIGLISAGMFVNANAYQITLLGAILLQISAIIDCIDGDVARLQFRESILGKWLDLTGDNIVHVFLFSCLTFREYSRLQTIEPLIFGSLLVLGAIISFLLVAYAQNVLKTYSNHSEASNAIKKMEQWLDKMSTRDFTVLLIIGAIIGNLYWFLCLAGIGTQIFWLILLGFIVMTKRQLCKK